MKFISAIAFQLSVLLLLLVSVAANAQSRTRPNVDSFIEAAIIAKFGSINTAYLVYCEYLIQENSRLGAIRKEYEAFSIKQVSKEQAIEIASLRQEKFTTLHSVNVTWQGRDTCNVDIDNQEIVLRSKERSIWKFLTPRARFVRYCRGTMGLIPTVRFVYDNNTRKWQMSTAKEIIESLRSS